ncbi:Flp pilus assembly secretin CpaC [Rhizobium sp. SG_E_25_P2]|uniref:pilus assembly protein N-terminal domain-containing protein n=1 Tax=Rhizobium sp. SG_E_25_P2 TaxID=2879942 RepID=UPI0024736CDF|nr:pilus assembly protein N-terminal domain-containing protein [Rhizobium sp. SG_E_25_P2]MDH6265334.1 Flp pilus assembly secretin CpaC [Rhizobium sp. SG_E_25_P2]
MRLPALFALLGTFIVAFGASTAQADDDVMKVFLNHAKVLKLDRPVAKVIVGNAAIADATVADAKTIVLTGKTYGATNIVLLDASGEAMLDERILVSIDEDNTLRLFRQTERTVFSCTPACEQNQAITASTGD